MLGSQELVYEFIKKGIKVNAKTSHGNTALHITCKFMKKSRRYFDIFEILVINGAHLFEENEDGKTPIDFIGTPSLQKEISDWLLTKGKSQKIRSAEKASNFLLKASRMSRIGISRGNTPTPF